MAKHMHTVRKGPAQNPLFVGTINLRELDQRVRRPKPPRTQVHRSLADYRRKPKHPTRGWD